MKAYKNPISLSDLWDLDDSEKSKTVAEELEKAWHHAMNKLIQSSYFIFISKI
jgi:hypothetical protein